MSGDKNTLLASAVMRLLRPLVRILLRNGIAFSAFTDMAKWVYVDVADKEFGIPGRKQTNSRISVITGLSRKEVLRIQRLPRPDDDEHVEKYNRAARVLSGWNRDHHFAGEDGNPKPLPIEGERGSFQALVKDYSGDVPYRAILDELVRVGTVRITKDQQVEMITAAYVPSGGELEKIGILGTDVQHLLDTIDHNLRSDSASPRYQRKVAYNNLPIEVLPRFRQLSATRAQALLEELDRWLADHDRDTHPDVDGTERWEAGLGIYYFEHPADRKEDEPHD